MGVIPEGCTNTLEGTRRSEVCKQQQQQQRALLPAQSRAPGELQPQRVSATDTATASLGKQTAPMPCGDALCKEKEPLDW